MSGRSDVAQKQSLLSGWGEVEAAVSNVEDQSGWGSNDGTPSLGGGRRVDEVWGGDKRSSNDTTPSSSSDIGPSSASAYEGKPDSCSTHWRGRLSKITASTTAKAGPSPEDPIKDPWLNYQPTEVPNDAFQRRLAMTTSGSARLPSNAASHPAARDRQPPASSRTERANVDQHRVSVNAMAPGHNTDADLTSTASAPHSAKIASPRSEKDDWSSWQPSTTEPTGADMYEKRKAEGALEKRRAEGALMINKITTASAGRATTSGPPLVSEKPRSDAATQASAKPADRSPDPKATPDLTMSPGSSRPLSPKTPLLPGTAPPAPAPAHNVDSRSRARVAEAIVTAGVPDVYKDELLERICAQGKREVAECLFDSEKMRNKISDGLDVLRCYE